MVAHLPLLGAAGALLLFAIVRAASPRREVPTRALVAVNLLRGGGAAFLVLARKGLLPAAIAERFGIGEIAVAILGAGVLWLLAMPLDRKPRSVVAWSAFGLVNVAWFALAWLREAPLSGDAWRMAALPLVLYPAIVLPLGLAAQLELLWRALRPADRQK